MSAATDTVAAVDAPEVAADGSGDTLERRVLIQMAIIARRLMQRFDQSVERAGMTRAKFSVIAVVGRRPGCTQRMIADTLSVTEVTAGRLVERLCADGYLERRAKSDDRRAHCIFLSPSAAPLLKELDGLAAIQEQEAFKGMAPEQRETLRGLLEIVLDNVDKTRARN